MARSYKRTTIDEKIDKQKEIVSRAKERYDAELQTLEENATNCGIKSCSER